MRLTRSGIGFLMFLMADIGAVAKARYSEYVSVCYFETHDFENPCTSTEVDYMCHPGGLGCFNDLGGKSSEPDQLFLDENCDIPLSGEF